jgi:Fe-S-cluster containining protein
MVRAKKSPFECQRCGSCCHELVGIFPMWNSEIGMPLFGDEINLFTSNLVLPVIVHGHVNGKIFDGTNFVSDSVLMYQLSANDCPHFTDDGCKIYDQRPAICRAFPLAVDLPALLQTGKTKTKIKSASCKAAPTSTTTSELRASAKQFAKNWLALSDKIKEDKKIVYIMDVNGHVRYKLTKWLDTPLTE